MKALPILGAAIAVVFSVSPVFAQTTAQKQARGFPLGDKSKIHTNLDLSMGFDSNPDRLDKGTSGSISDWRALIRPGVAVDVPGTHFSFNLEGAASIQHFFGAGDIDSETTFGGNFGLKLRLGSPTSVVSFQVQDMIVRTPTYFEDLGTIAADERRFREWDNRGQARFTIRPGGGALEFDLGYDNEFAFYDDWPTSQRHGIVLEARLRFLPKTAAFFHSDLSFFSSTEDVSTLRSTPYNIMLGIVGQITNRFTTNLAVGFGDSLTWQGDFFSDVSTRNLRTVIGTAEVTFAASEAVSVSVGFKREVKPIIFLDNYIGSAPYLRAVTNFGRLQFKLYGNYEFREYGGEDTVQILTGDAKVEYWFFDFLVGGVGYRLLYQNGDGPVSTGTGSGGLLVEDYSRHQALLTVGLRY